MAIDPHALHKENTRIHAAMRFRERYGQDLTPKLRSRFHRMVEGRTGAWMVDKHRTTDIYFIFDATVSAEPIVAVYRRDFGEFVTFLTPLMYQRQIEVRYHRYLRHPAPTDGDLSARVS